MSSFFSAFSSALVSFSVNLSVFVFSSAIVFTTASEAAGLLSSFAFSVVAAVVSELVALAISSAL